jgi:hypothetical protein
VRAPASTIAHVRGLVDQIDEGVARVFVGDNDDAWFFPAHLFPAGTVAGDCIWLDRVNGTYTIVGSTRHRSNPDVRGFTDRLNRLRTDRRGGRKLHAPRSDRSPS